LCRDAGAGQFYLPEIGACSRFALDGFRAATPDKLPLIVDGRRRDVLLATGHEGLGITTSLATARLIADGADRRGERDFDATLFAGGFLGAASAGFEVDRAAASEFMREAMRPSC